MNQPSPFRSKTRQRLRANSISISAWDCDAPIEIPSPLLKLKTFVVKPSNTNNSLFDVKGNGALNRTSGLERSEYGKNAYGRRLKTLMAEGYESGSLKVFEQEEEFKEMKNTCYIWKNNDSIFFNALRGVSCEISKKKDRSKDDSCIRRRRPLSILHQRRYSKTPIINIRGPEEDDLIKKVKSIKDKDFNEKRSKEGTKGRQKDKQKEIEKEKKKEMQRQKERYHTTLSNDTLVPLQRERRYIKRSWKKRFQMIPSKMDY